MTAERLAQAIKDLIDDAVSDRTTLSRDEMARTIERALRERNFLARVQP